MGAARDSRATLLALLLLLAAPAPAVIVAAGDGNGNTRAPAADFGWAHVGTRAGGLSAVYLGDGWMLATAHGGAGDVRLVGETWPLERGSRVQLSGRDGRPTDLALFRIRGDPGLPRLPLLSAALRPGLGAEVVMAGHGANRGSEILVAPNGRIVVRSGARQRRFRLGLHLLAAPQPLGPPAGGTSLGWAWARTARLRWGTNRVAAYDVVQRDSEVFVTKFDPRPESDRTAYECQAARGDSGGGVFVRVEGRWWLMGILLGVNRPGFAYIGDATYAVDLTRYAETIRAVTGRSDCSDAEDNDGDGRIDRDAAGRPDTLADPDCLDRVS